MYRHAPALFYPRAQKVIPGRKRGTRSPLASGASLIRDQRPSRRQTGDRVLASATLVDLVELPPGIVKRSFGELRQSDDRTLCTSTPQPAHKQRRSPGKTW
jgi:hypothetical protein